MTTITYAVGDIHGRLDLLDRLLAAIEADAAAHDASATIVFTGDYLDRGADSFGVVERLIAGPARAGDRFICLRGNHDDLFARAVTGNGELPAWAWLLFWHTLKSYGLTRETRHTGDDSALLRHAAFLAGLPLTHDDGTHLFVHAGIRPGVALDAQADDDLMWIRAEFLDHAGPLPRRVVHGHTIMGDRPVVTGNRISIDTGAFRSGVLTAAVLDGTGAVRFLHAIGEPDRGAIVREHLLAATVHGWPVTPAMRVAYDDYEAGRIDAATMLARTRHAEAA